MQVAQIRSEFLNFFAEKGHTIVPSSSLVPANDPTLMFTNSGMVQFKDVFLGQDKRPYNRATSVQACLRAGGKHNDLENVGYTARHHTFFEMLGNWSFGNYFKKESIEWGWELLTKVYGLAPERLLATVYIDDDEAYDIWTQVIGLPPERVIRIGDNKGGKYKSDNFWMMADTGPCGPCSEIFYDHGAHIAGGPPGSPDEDGDRFIEIWNHVFMQFDMKEDGSVVKLPAPCVDTGMGLERLAAILQGVHSNYEIDLFVNLINAASRETGCSDTHNPSLRVIADHIRACSFLISDGVIPSNEGRGYVLRRIIRRAIRHGYKLGVRTPFFHKMVPDLVKEMGEAYPNLAAKHSTVVQTLQQEEERFFETIANGMDILDTELAKLPADGTLSGDIAFKLHDTFGFPLDLTGDVCRERGYSVDGAGFEAAMNAQKENARAAGKFKMNTSVEYNGVNTQFTGYERLSEQATVLALYKDGVEVEQLNQDEHGIVVLNATPFYAESGGQVGDTGELVCSDVRFAVRDTQKIKSDVIGHHGLVLAGSAPLRVGDNVSADVNLSLRQATMRNHSATHLMHSALRRVLGEHVQQKGSLVDADKTRFDFTHNAPVTADEIAQIEQWVNQQILGNAATSAQVMAIDDAKNSGAMMLFGEKYGDQVRVLTIGESKELCGGTHVHATGDIGLFKIISEGGVAAGVRRIEAITGMNALTYTQNLANQVAQAAAALKSAPSELVERIQGTQEQIKALEKELTTAKGKLAAAQGGDLAAQAVDVNGVKLLTATLEGADIDMLRNTMDSLKDKLGTAVIVLASVVAADKVTLLAGVTKDLTGKIKAGEVVNHVAQQIGGKGGGRPDLAQAGGTDVAGLAGAMDSMLSFMGEKLS